MDGGGVLAVTRVLQNSVWSVLGLEVMVRLHLAAHPRGETRRYGREVASSARIPIEEVPDCTGEPLKCVSKPCNARLPSFWPTQDNPNDEAVCIDEWTIVPSYLINQLMANHSKDEPPYSPTFVV